jgi:hypothetical protein
MTTRDQQIKAKISKKQALRELWKRGNLDYKRHSGQVRMKKYIDESDSDIIPILASRRMGKSFELLIEAVELCNIKPNAIVKYICPRLKMVKTIVGPNMRAILEDCPEDMRPTWKENDKIWLFPNGAEIQFAGTDNGSHEGLRGGAADFCIVDEAGFCDHLDYVIKSILRPTILTTDGKIVMISTPSKSSDHEFMRDYVDKTNNILVLNIHDNPMLTAEKIERLKRDYPAGDKDPQYRREYLCESVRDQDTIVVPEFTPELEKEIVTEWDRPDHFDAYTSGDIGFKDLSIYLFAYWDYMNATLVIEDELVMNGMTTQTLADGIREKEQSTFQDKFGEPKHIYMRVMDNNLIVANDLSRLHNLPFIPTAKDNKDAQINQLRMMIANKQIRINPRCKHLIYHLRNAEWKATSGTIRTFAHLSDSPDFSIKGGHADAVDALIYLVRNLVRHKNPFPKDWGKPTGDHLFQTRIAKADESGLMDTIKAMLNMK